MKKILFGVGVAALGFGAYQARQGVLGHPHELIEYVRASGATTSSALVFAVTFLIGTSLLVPSTAFYTVAAVVFGFERAMVLSVVVMNVVSNLQFGLGRVLGRQWVRGFLQRRKWVRVEALLEMRGTAAIFGIRQLPLPFFGVNIAAGASGVRWHQFALGSGLGALLHIFFYTYFSAAILAGMESFSGRSLLLFLGAVVAIGLLAHLLWRRRNRGAAPP